MNCCFRQAASFDLDQHCKSWSVFLSLRDQVKIDVATLLHFITLDFSGGMPVPEKQNKELFFKFWYDSDRAR